MTGIFFFSSRRRHTRFDCDWSSDGALPILTLSRNSKCKRGSSPQSSGAPRLRSTLQRSPEPTNSDRKSTRLNSSHSQISYAVFCLKKKKKKKKHKQYNTNRSSRQTTGRIAR